MDHQPHQHQYPGSQNVPKQQWQSSLFNCAPCGTCLLGSFLPCILIGRTSARMRDPSMQDYEDLNSECMIFSAIQCVTGCGWIYAMMKRGEIRDQYGIEGSDCSDCCASYCCPCCVLIQNDKEVKSRTASHVPSTQGYQSEKEGMHMPTPGYPQHQPPQLPMVQPEQPEPQQPIKEQPMQPPAI